MHSTQIVCVVRIWAEVVDRVLREPRGGRTDRRPAVRLNRCDRVRPWPLGRESDVHAVGVDVWQPMQATGSRIGGMGKFPPSPGPAQTGWATSAGRPLARARLRESARVPQRAHDPPKRDRDGECDPAGGPGAASAAGLGDRPSRLRAGAGRLEAARGLSRALSGNAVLARARRSAAARAHRPRRRRRRELRALAVARERLRRLAAGLYLTRNELGCEARTYFQAPSLTA